MTNRVSLAELAAADIPLHPAEAVTLVAEICRQHASGDIPGIPSPGIIRLTSDGEVLAQGPMTKEEATVSRAGHLLNDLLPGADAPGDYRASGALRLVIARALGTLDLPPYASLGEFSIALARFGTSDISGTARGLFRLWEERQGAPTARAAAPALTISDIRRARRATGWSLDDLGSAAGVPAARLRELEWGYVRNWPADGEGREQIVRYARAAGLDEAVVLSIAWPLVANGQMAESDEGEPTPVTALVPAGPQEMATIAAPVRRRAPSGLLHSALYVAVAALLALATFGIAIESSAQGTRGGHLGLALALARAQALNTPAPAPVRAALPVERSAPPRSAAMASAPRPSAAMPSAAKAKAPAPGLETRATARPLARPAPQPRRPAPVREAGLVASSAVVAAPDPESPAAAGPLARPDPQPRGKVARARSFFSRELFRIVIK